MRLAILIVVLVLIGTSNAGAWISAPYNGGFDGSADGWTGGGYWTGSQGYPASGALAVTTGHAQSLPVRASGTWTLRYYCKGTAGNLVVVDITNHDTSVVTWTVQAQIIETDAWQVVTVPNFTAGVYYFDVYSSDGSTIYFDGIEATGAVIGDTPAGTPTPNPTAAPTSPPGATSTPGKYSGNDAMARVTVSAATPYYRGVVASAVPTPNPGAARSELSVFDLDVQNVALCLPLEVTSVFTDVSLCLSIPTYTATNFSLLGGDLLGPISGLMLALVLVFIVSRLQAR